MGEAECFERLADAEKTARFFQDEDDPKLQTFERFNPFDHSCLVDETSPHFGEEEPIFAQGAPGKGISQQEL